MHINNYNESKKVNPGPDQKREAARAEPPKCDEHDQSTKETAAGDSKRVSGAPQAKVK
jgi:hypothetical protein